MEQYISKSALVAEIERRIKEREEEEKKGWAYSRVKIVECEHILSFIDTLDVKEVNLDSEIRRYRMNNPIIGHKEESLYDYMANVAKHFFGLGLNAQKRA